MFWRILAQYSAVVFMDYLTLICWSWTSSFVLGFLSRRTVLVNGALFCLALLFGELLGAPQYRYDVNAAVFSRTFYSVMFPLIPQNGPGFAPFTLGNASGSPAGHAPTTAPDNPVGCRSRNHDCVGDAALGLVRGRLANTASATCRGGAGWVHGCNCKLAALERQDCLGLTVEAASPPWHWLIPPRRVGDRLARLSPEGVWQTNATGSPVFKENNT